MAATAGATTNSGPGLSSSPERGIDDASDGSSSDETISASPRPSRTFPVRGTGKSPLWKRPEPENSNFGHKRRRLAASAASDQPFTVRQLFNLRGNSTSRIKSTSRTQDPNVRHLDSIPEVMEVSEMSQSQVDEENEETSVDPSALCAINSFRPSGQQNSVARNITSIEVVLQSSRDVYEIPNQGSEAIAASNTHPSKDAAANHQEPARVAQTNALSAIPRLSPARERQRRKKLLLALPVEPADPSSQVAGELASADVPRVNPGTLSRAIEDGPSMPSRESSSEDDNASAIDHDILTPEVSELVKVSIKGKKPPQRGIMDFEGLENIHIPRYRPYPGYFHPNSPPTSVLPSTSIRSVSTQQQPTSRISPGTSALVKTVTIHSATLRDMRYILGLDIKKLWVSKLLNDLSKGTQPETVASKLAGRFFRYLSILKADCDRAPKAPDFEKQAGG